MNILTFELRTSCMSSDVFSIYNVCPGEFRPGIPDVDNFRAPGLGIKNLDIKSCELNEAISFDPKLPKAKRNAIMDCLQGKDSPAKLYCCDLSSCRDGARLYFVFSMERLNSAYMFDYTEVHLRGLLEFTVTNARNREAYNISIYQLVEDSGSEYSYFIETLKDGMVLYNLRIIKSRILEVTQFNY